MDQFRPLAFSESVAHSGQFDRDSVIILRGVLFRCTIRGGHASLAVILTGISRDKSRKPSSGCGDISKIGKVVEISAEDYESKDNMVLVIVRFGGSEWDPQNREAPNIQGEIADCMLEANTRGESDNFANLVSKNHAQLGNRSNEGPEFNVKETTTKMRSHIRRMCKIGNEMEFRGKFATEIRNRDLAEITPTEDFRQWERFIVDYFLPSHSQPHKTNVNVCCIRKWASPRCQMIRAKYFGTPLKHKQHQTPQSKAKCPNLEDTRNALAGTANSIDEKLSGKQSKYPSDTTLGPIRTDRKNSRRVSPNERRSQHQQKKQNQRSPHGGGVGKRKQGEIMAEFLIWILTKTNKYQKNTINNDSTLIHPAHEEFRPTTNVSACQGSSDKSDLKESGRKIERRYLWMERLVSLPPSFPFATFDKGSTFNNDVKDEKNDNPNGRNITKYRHSITGEIIDAAGGAGHVSLALALRGIHSTVVDPRPSAGRLPGRDRKALKKALGKSNGKEETKTGSYMKAVPFATFRAWFGSKPDGVDTFFREGSTYNCYEDSTSTSDCATRDNQKEEATNMESSGNKEVNNRTIDPSCYNVKNVVSPYEGGQNLLKFSDLSSSSATGWANNMDPTTIPICCMCSEDQLLSNCTAIVALHPDEATGSIVETAVEHKIPFVVVPCCVFSRLFPDRKKYEAKMKAHKPSRMKTKDDQFDFGQYEDTTTFESGVVSTYDDLIDWLVAKHPAIRVTRLPFDGANLALWATFD